MEFLDNTIGCLHAFRGPKDVLDSTTITSLPARSRGISTASCRVQVGIGASQRCFTPADWCFGCEMNTELIFVSGATWPPDDRGVRGCFMNPKAC